MKSVIIFRSPTNPPSSFVDGVQNALLLKTTTATRNCQSHNRDLIRHHSDPNACVFFFFFFLFTLVFCCFLIFCSFSFSHPSNLPLHTLVWIVFFVSASDEPNTQKQLLPYLLITEFSIWCSLLFTKKKIILIVTYIIT